MSDLSASSLWEIRDKRVDHWYLMSSPVPTIIASLIYWIISLYLGPLFMSNRPAYELKRTIQLYNLTQILLSAYLFYECCASGWLTHYNWLCQNIELEEKGLRMASVSYYYYLSKFFEFSDTFFFILKKKYTHVSKLQLLHHGLMPIYGYVLVRWLPGGHETFGGAFKFQQFGSRCDVFLLLFGLVGTQSVVEKVLDYVSNVPICVCIFAQCHSSFGSCGTMWVPVAI